MVTFNIDERIDALAVEIEFLRAQSQDKITQDKLLTVVAGAAKSIEDPVDSIWKLIFSPHVPAALMTMIKSGAVSYVVSAGRPVTANDIARNCGADELLIVRMMRLLSTQGIFHETAKHTYEATATSQALTKPSLMGGFQFQYETATHSLVNLPGYLARKGYRDIDGTPGPFQDCFKTEDSMYGHLMKNPKLMDNFDAFMSGVLGTRPDWFKTFPVDDILLKDAKVDDPESVLLVDIAGGEGHDVQAFHRAFPDAPGRLILQDLPAVIDNIKELDSCVERQKHDFFAPQTVHGARAYYFRNVLLNWPDASVEIILGQIAAAMTPGYSKLLIFELILPDQGAATYPAQLDINMMTLLNGKVRTETEWRTLLGKVGLTVVELRTASPNAERLIEAMRLH